MIADLTKNDIIGADTETSALKPHEGVVIGHCFASMSERGKFKGYYVPVRHSVEGTKYKNMYPSTVESLLKSEIYENEKIKKIFFNVKFDYNFLRRHQIFTKNTEDLMIFMFLRNENRQNHRLKSLATEFLKADFANEEKEVKGYFKKNKCKNYGEIPIDILGTYAARDPIGNLAMWIKYKEFIEPDTSATQDGVRESIYLHERDYTMVVADMEWEGFPFDRSVCDNILSSLDPVIEMLGNHIYGLVGEEFNIDSPKELMRVMGNAGHIPTEIKWPSKVPTWHKGNLMRLKNEIGECVAAYRNFTHNRSVYVAGLPIWEHEGRIRCSYNQIGARTGRASASEPPMQGISKRLPRYSRVPSYVNDVLKMVFSIRKAFVAPDGFQILSCDQSQFELRMLQHYAQDPTLGRAFAGGRDVHSDTAARLFGYEYADLIRRLKDGNSDAKFHRITAKEINFAIIYGAGARRLKSSLEEYGLDISEDEAKQFRFRYFDIYTRIQDFVYKVQGRIKRRGYIFNHYGRHKRVPASKAYVGVNYLIQGVTADMLKDSMLRISDLLEGKKSRIVLAVHDEIDFLLHDDEHDLVPLIKEEMQDFPWANVPIQTDVQIGPNWYDLKPYT